MGGTMDIAVKLTAYTSATNRISKQRQEDAKKRKERARVEAVGDMYSECR